MRTITRQPEPEPGETGEDFVDRCMAFEGLQDMDPDQRAAVCWDAYRQSVAPPDEGGGEAAANSRTKLSELKRQRGVAAQRMRAIVEQEDALAEGETLPPSVLDEFKGLEAKTGVLDARIKRHEAAMTADARSACNCDQPGAATTAFAGALTRGGVRVLATPKRHGKEGKGFKIARFILGIAYAKSHGREKAAEFVLNRFGDDDVAKALTISVVAEGGALIPQDFMAELIELLRSAVVVRSANPQTVSMPLGNLTIPRLAGGASAAYQGELDDIKLTQQEFDDLNLYAKKLTAMVPISNDLLRRAPINVETIVVDDLVATLARKEDVTFLRSDGSNLSPTGWRSLVLPDNLVVIPAGANLDAVVAGLSSLKLVLINGLSRMLRPAWFMAPTVIEFIRNRRDEVGGFYYKDEIDRGTLDGYPIFMSQQIPTNLAGGNGSEIYLVDMADTVIGDTMEAQVDISDVAAYYGTDGKVVSAFQRDQSLVRIISAHDFNMRHLQSLAIGLTSDWYFEGLPGVPGRPWSTQPLNPTWAKAPAAWPADAITPDPPPTLWDPAVAMTSAFAGPLTNNPGGLPRPENGGGSDPENGGDGGTGPENGGGSTPPEETSGSAPASAGRRARGSSAENGRPAP